MTNLLSSLLHPTREVERRYASCEGFATEHGTALHLREIGDEDWLYFGGGLLEEDITAACGEAVNWDDHLYSQVELEATIQLQGHGFYFCQPCLQALNAASP